MDKGSKSVLDCFLGHVMSARFCLTSGRSLNYPAWARCSLQHKYNLAAAMETNIVIKLR